MVKFSMELTVNERDEPACLDKVLSRQVVKEHRLSRL